MAGHSFSDVKSDREGATSPNVASAIIAKPAPTRHVRFAGVRLRTVRSK